MRRFYDLIIFKVVSWVFKILRRRKKSFSLNLLILSCLIQGGFFLTESKAETKAQAGVQVQKKAQASQVQRLKIPSLSKEQLEANKKELNRRVSPLISPMTHKKMERVFYLVERSKFDKAIERLMRLQKSVKKRSHELAAVYRQLGLVYLQKENYDLALQFIHKALSLKSLSKYETLDLMFQLAYLYILKEDPVKSLSVVNEWFYYQNQPPPKAYILRASGYYELGYKKEALEQVEKALLMTRNSIPRKKSWLQMGGVINLELKNFSRAVDLLKELVTYYPKYKVHWIQLGGAYISMKRNDKALAVFEMAYKLGFLSKEGEILNLVSLYLDQKAPLKAAKLLDKEMSLKRVTMKKRNLEILANSYTYAEETKKALYFYKKAADLSEGGKLSFDLGQLYMGEENWRDADKALTQALSKGGIKDMGDLYLALGIVKYKIKKKDLASKLFKKALKAKNVKESIKQGALEWIQQIKRDQSVLL